MSKARVDFKTAVLILTAAWAAVFMAGCGTIREIFTTPTPWVFSSVTPQTSQTPVPTRSSSPEEMSSATPIVPVQPGTPLQPSGQVISIENASGLQQVVNAGLGTPLQMALSQEGKLLGISTSNGVYLYDPINLERRLTIHTGEQQLSLAFSADGSKLVSGDWHGSVNIWNTAGHLLLSLDTGRQPVQGVAFSPDGKGLAAAGWDGTIRLWNTEDGTLQRTITVRNKAVKAVSFSPDGSLLYGWAPGESIQVWEAEDGKPQDDIYLGKDPYSYLPSKLVFGSMGDQAAVYYTRSVKVFTARNGYTRLALNDLTGRVQGLALSEDGDTLAVMVEKEQPGTVIEIYDLENDVLVTRVLPADINVREQMTLSPDGKRLVTLGTSVQSWDLTGNGEQTNPARTGNGQEFLSGTVINSRTAENNRVYLAGLHGSLDLYDFSQGVSSSIFSAVDPSEAGAFTGSAILPGRLAAFGDAAGNVTLINLQAGGTVTGLQPHKQAVRSVAFSADGSQLASGGADGRIVVYDLAAGSAVMELDAGAAVFRMAFFENEAGDKYLIVQTAAEIQIRSLIDGTLLTQLAAQGMTIPADGGFLAGVSRDAFAARVNIYHLPDGEVLQSMPVEGYRLSLSPDGRLLAMAGKDLTLWSVSDGSLLHRLPDVPCCGQIQFTPDGASLVQVLPDGSIQVWQIR